MASLYKRASGPQQRMLKIISGAVMNAAHAHPEYNINAQFARSVAKRAVGTLSAQMVETLAAGTPSGTDRHYASNAVGSERHDASLANGAAQADRPCQDDGKAEACL
jgi:hypothetical protein